MDACCLVHTLVAVNPMHALLYIIELFRARTTCAACRPRCMHACLLEDGLSRACACTLHVIGGGSVDMSCDYPY